MKMTAGIHSRKSHSSAMTTMIAMNLGIDFWVRQLIALKLGYLTPLNIMNERNNMSGGSTHLAEPRLCSPSHHNKKSVSDAMSPAAAGIGKPLNSLPAPEIPAA